MSVKISQVDVSGQFCNMARSLILIFIAKETASLQANNAHTPAATYTKPTQGSKWFSKRVRSYGYLSNSIYHKGKMNRRRPDEAQLSVTMVSRPLSLPHALCLYIRSSPSKEAQSEGLGQEHLRRWRMNWNVFVRMKREVNHCTIIHLLHRSFVHCRAGKIKRIATLLHSVHPCGKYGYMAQTPTCAKQEQGKHTKLSFLLSLSLSLSLVATFQQCQLQFRLVCTIMRACPPVCLLRL